MLVRSAHALALLLASLLVASQVEAGGLKSLVCRDKSYEKLANNLYKLTPSSELKDNIAAATQLNQNVRLEKESCDQNDPLTAFTLLKDTTSEEEICDVSRLRSLHLLAEAMAARGNLRPKKMTEPIRRLNLIIIKQIMRAEDVCFEHLAKKAPNPWKVAESLSYAYNNLQNLDKISRSRLLDSQQDLHAGEHAEFGKWLYMPCVLVQASVAAKSILEPYLDLLMAAYIIDPESNKMTKFYEEPGEQIVFKQIHHPNKEVLDNAYRRRACDLLSAKIEKDRLKKKSIKPAKL